MVQFVYFVRNIDIMIDELRQIAIFAKTVDHGSFRAAAQSLRLSPSVVSHHVGQLEKSLGTALLYRSTRKLSLTPDGERLLTAAYAMIDAAESGLQAVVNQVDQPSGMLRITAPAVLAQSDLATQFAEFSLAYPQVQLTIDFADTPRELIADGFDISIRAGTLKDSSLKVRKLFDFQRRLVAAPQYLETRSKKPVSPDDVVDWDWLELTPVWRQKLAFRSAGKRKTVTIRRTRLSVNSAHALCHLSRSGAGIAIAPEFLVEPDISVGALQHVLPKWTVDPVSVFAVWPMNAPKYGLVKHFVNFLADTTRKIGR